MAKKKIDQAACFFCGQHPCECKRDAVGSRKPKADQKETDASS